MATAFPTDDPSQARAELLAAVQKIQAIIAATGTGASHSLKLDSNGKIPSGTKSAGTVSDTITDDGSSVTINGGVSNIPLKVISTDTISLIAFEDSGTTTPDTIYVGAVANELLLASTNAGGTMAFQTGATNALTLDSVQDASFAGNVSLKDNKSIYLGTSKAIGIFFDGASTTFIQTLISGGNIQIVNKDGSGNNKAMINMSAGSGTSNVATYYNGSVAYSSRSGGLAFGSDSAAANTLDDYEEGNWTAVLSDGTNNATTDTSNCTYEKIGRQVTVRIGWFSTSSLGSVTGNIRITGLPYAAASSGFDNYAVYAGIAGGLAITAGHTVSGSIPQSTTYIQLAVWDAATGTTNMQATEWTSDGRIQLTATYYV